MDEGCSPTGAALVRSALREDYFFPLCFMPFPDVSAPMAPLVVSGAAPWIVSVADVVVVTTVSVLGAGIGACTVVVSAVVVVALLSDFLQPATATNASTSTPKLVVFISHHP